MSSTPVNFLRDPKYVRHKRENLKRIFSNRDLLMEKVKFIGFDMDYTLAEYISPLYEKLTLRHAIKELIDIGYPAELIDASYDEKFASRGIIFDKKYGNFLKIDPYGNIMKTVYGLKPLDLDKSREQYINRFIDMENTKRFANIYTLFELPSVYLISYIIEVFEKKEEWVRNDSETGFIHGSLELTYSNIYDDVINVFNNVHNNRDMKQETLDDISTYVQKDDRLALLLKRIRDLGLKTMLVTNSNYWYTNGVLTYLLGDSKKINETFSNDWKDYFDLIVVDANKPKFFAEGISMTQIDVSTGKKYVGVHTGKIRKNNVFSGGNSQSFCQLLGCVGKEILFVGDHIFGDILRSKKKQGWRTFLVIPELLEEIPMWVKNKKNYLLIDQKEAELSNKFRNLDSSSTTPTINMVEEFDDLKTISKQIDDSYGMFGSLFRCGSRQSYFANQIIKYADLYSHSVLNMLNYPLFYFFSSPMPLMPHEGTTNIEEELKE